jgi:hypothetical protein
MSAAFDFGFGKANLGLCFDDQYSNNKINFKSGGQECPPNTADVQYPHG